MVVLLQGHAWVAGVVVVLGTSAAGLGLLFLVRRASARKPYEPHNAVLAGCLGFVGTIYAITSVFTMFHELGGYDRLRQDLRKEAFVVASIAMDSSVMGGAAQRGIEEAVRSYNETVLAEWPRTARGEFSTRVETARKQLMGELAELRPRTEAQRTYVSESLKAVQEATAGQEYQLFVARSGLLEAVVWCALLVSAAAALLFCCLFRLREWRLQALLVAVIGLVVGSNLFLVLDLSYPMAGLLSVSPDGYAEVMHLFLRR
ncbi:DUF4239 domain-containing protein [Streptomyces spongiicola]|uniref:DUF4239 domain-containing protein n=1 Tax=Streptomyces spongiicola TaxID=1690221 RepID=A0A2S1Z483_9ACTN|nr:DUF4239 domain-containing protein [Streptomyces spongiicola]AWK11132.1 hypothetical protein DDQ41_21925 [Streptomyces spongiicola]GBQ00333.1 DUF4239 domain-containing protein [Streptomyces spongiicola]